MKKIPIIVVAGATASGKTALSIELAKKFDGEIVSADSMQIYKEMNIGTAKPDCGERGSIPHHLMDCIEPDSLFSVADYVAAAHPCIKDIAARGKLPVVVGGTGLYINSLVNDITFDEGGEDAGIRSQLWKMAGEQGAEAMLAMLAEFDPDSASRLHPNNLRRVIRAIEFYRVTGKTITRHNQETAARESRYIPLMMAIRWDMQALYERIEKRVDLMLKAGLLEEVISLAQKGYNTKYQSMQGIGYKQLLDFYRGFSTYDEATRILKRDSRRYAKRQMTWFRRDPRIQWIEADDDILKKAIGYTEEFLTENLTNW